MKIFIDFDDVLFNTKDFKNDLLNIFIENGITEEQFRSSYWGKTYNLEKQIKSIEKEYDVNSEKLEKDIDDLLRDLKKYVFRDVCDFLNFVGKENIFIASYGHKKFQEQKIKNSGLRDYFKDTFITHSSKAKVIQDVIKNEDLKNETLYFLDDRISYIKEVKNIIPEIKTILMKRPEGRYDDDPSDKCDFMATNLNEVNGVINKS